MHQEDREKEDIRGEPNRPDHQEPQWPRPFGKCLPIAPCTRYALPSREADASLLAVMTQLVPMTALYTRGMRSPCRATPSRRVSSQGCVKSDFMQPGRLRDFKQG